MELRTGKQYPPPVGEPQLTLREIAEKYHLIEQEHGELDQRLLNIEKFYNEVDAATQWELYQTRVDGRKRIRELEDASEVVGDALTAKVLDRDSPPDRKSPPPSGPSERWVVSPDSEIKEYWKKASEEEVIATYWKLKTTKKRETVIFGKLQRYYDNLDEERQMIQLSDWQREIEDKQYAMGWSTATRSRKTRAVETLGDLERLFYFEHYLAVPSPEKLSFWKRRIGSRTVFLDFLRDVYQDAPPSVLEAILEQHLKRLPKLVPFATPNGLFDELRAMLASLEDDEAGSAEEKRVSLLEFWRGQVEPPARRFALSGLASDPEAAGDLNIGLTNVLEYIAKIRFVEQPFESVRFTPPNEMRKTVARFYGVEL